jgi:DNA (cytosine-5)-methyltransferase 1
MSKALKESGYLIKYKVLNALEYANLPQNRERIFIVGFKEKEEYDRFDFPEPVPFIKANEVRPPSGVIAHVYK